jgi:hypothetical protein
MGVKGWQSISLRKGIYERIREQVRSKRVGGAINEALMFLVMEDFFAYSDPYEWLEAKAKELCGEVATLNDGKTQPAPASPPSPPSFFGEDKEREEPEGEGDDFGFVLEF